LLLAMATVLSDISVERCLGICSIVKFRSAVSATPMHRVPRCAETRTRLKLDVLEKETTNDPLAKTEATVRGLLPTLFTPDLAFHNGRKHKVVG